MKRGGNFKCYPHGKVLLICFVTSEEGPNGAEVSYCQSKKPYHVNLACINFAFRKIIMISITLYDDWVSSDHAVMPVCRP